MASMTMEELSKKLSKIDFCMFNTNGPESIVSRPMSNNGDVECDGDSWFFSYVDTKKIADINRDARVTLTFTAPPSMLGKPGIFVAVNGEAELIRDKAPFEDHWTKNLDRWFPEGTETPGIILIKVSAQAIEYWDGEKTDDCNRRSSMSSRRVQYDREGNAQRPNLGRFRGSGEHGAG